MEEERNQSQSVVCGEEGREVEVKDRGLFDFMGKKEEKEKEKEKEKIEEEDLVAGMEKVRVEEVEDKKEEEEKKKGGFLEKLHRSHSSSSSSSSDEEEGGEGENKEKKKKKKGLKEKIKERLGGGDKGEEEKETVVVVAQEEFVEAVPAAEDDAAVTVEVVEGTAKLDGAPEGGEKKGFLEKIKEKLPGHKKPSEEAAAAAAPTVETAAECAKESNDTVVDANEGKENKKGFLGKIMEKLPGYSKGGEEKEKEPEKTSACN